jgi:hypothetical protein
MSRRLLQRGAVRSAILLAASGLLAGCGGTAAGVHVTPAPPDPITEAQALAYAHAVNLQAGTLPEFTSNGSETDAPAPGRSALEYDHCRRGVNPALRIADISSAEFSSTNSSSGDVLKSNVEVWATPALVALNNTRSHSPRGRECLARLLDATHKRINQERKGQRRLGPFTVTMVHDPLPGVSHSFVTTLNETLLTRTGVPRAHIHRDIFCFITGPAEVELEAFGVGHRVPASIEQGALRLLLSRATANVI